MSRRRAMLVSAISLGLLTNACGGTPTDAGATPVAPATAASQPSPAANALLGYLRDNFGPPVETTWYRNVKAVLLAGSTLELSTDLYPDSDARDPASKLCSAVSGWLFQNGARYQLEGLAVKSSTGSMLIKQTFPSGASDCASAKVQI